MLLHSFLSAGALAWTANAFLVTAAFAYPFETIPSKILEQTFNETVRLDCSTCPFALSSDRHGQHEWAFDVKSELEMKFALENGRLTLNGVPFYPISSPLLPAMLSVKQVQKESDASAKKWEGYQGDLTLSYDLEIIEKQRHFQEEDADIVSITLSVMGLESQMINVDDILIRLIETKDLIMIISIAPLPGSSIGQYAECTTILCRVLSKLKGTIHSAKGAANSAIEKVKDCCRSCMSLFKAGCMKLFHSKHRHGGQRMHPAHYPAHIDAKPGHYEDHAPHKHHRGWLHSFLGGVKRGFATIVFIVLPIIIGIASGFIAITVAMVVGLMVVQFALSCWRLRRNSGSEIIYKPVESEEKDGLPAYEDVEVVDATDDKDVAEKV